jgi:hypothetical protein
VARRRITRSSWPRGRSDLDPMHKSFPQTIITQSEGKAYTFGLSPCFALCLDASPICMAPKSLHKSTDGRLPQPS